MNISDYGEREAGYIMGQREQPDRQRRFCIGENEDV